MTVVFGRSFGIINPTRWMGSILRFWMFLPLVPGFPLVCGWLVRVLVVILVVLIVSHCGMMDLDGSVDVPTMQGEV